MSVICHGHHNTIFIIIIRNDFPILISILAPSLYFSLGKHRWTTLNCKKVGNLKEKIAAKRLTWKTSSVQCSLFSDHKPTFKWPRLGRYLTIAPFFPPVVRFSQWVRPTFFTLWPSFLGLDCLPSKWFRHERGGSQTQNISAFRSGPRPIVLQKCKCLTKYIMEIHPLVAVN